MDYRNEHTGVLQQQHVDIERELGEVDRLLDELAQKKPKNWRDYSIRDQTSEAYARQANLLREHMFIVATLDSRGAPYTCAPRRRR